MPPQLLEGEPPGNSMWFEFPLVFNERPQLWLEHREINKKILLIRLVQL